MTCHLLLVLGESLVHDLADTGIETLEFLILGRDIRGGWLRGEDAHEAREETVHGADHLRVGACHAGCDTTLQRLEAQQNHLLSLATKKLNIRSYYIVL